VDDTWYGGPPAPACLVLSAHKTLGRSIPASVLR
jgi:hypothetical protein